MEALVMVIIPMIFLIVLVVGIGMFVDVALFDGGRIAAQRERLARLWEPPYVRGRELLSWARERGAALARKVLSSDMEEGRPLDVVEELHAGATLAMLPRVPERETRRPVPCPVGGQGVIGLTTPEVIDLVAWLRSNVSAHRRQAILEQARELSEADGRHPSGCALQGEDCVCMAYAARPLRCRPLHAASIMGDTLGPAPKEEGPHRAHARVVAEGVEEGWTRTLSAAGRDGRVYELNSALAVALASPDLGPRWAAGEAVLDGCPTTNGVSLRL